MNDKDECMVACMIQVATGTMPTSMKAIVRVPAWPAWLVC
jgi:hypothetical protein